MKVFFFGGGGWSGSPGPSPFCNTGGTKNSIVSIVDFKVLQNWNIKKNCTIDLTLKLNYTGHWKIKMKVIQICSQLFKYISAGIIWEIVLSQNIQSTLFKANTIWDKHHNFNCPPQRGFRLQTCRKMTDTHHPGTNTRHLSLASLHWCLLRERVH